MSCSKIVSHIRLAGPIQSDSVVDGEGLRTVIWCQGCYRKCKGCHNPESWNIHGGIVMTLDEIKRYLRNLKGQTGVTFSGGEPMLQAKSCREIALWAKDELGWNVWSFTGYRYEDIVAQKEHATPEMIEFLKVLDVLIDGPFELDKRDLSLRFRGSSNQRLLRLQEGKIIAIE